ncbi:MAG: hypothetical protein HRT71_13230 [Flavobacteriales bacterium]|nr:hypothetical protein [Flavobacteriales bacterium]
MINLNRLFSAGFLIIGVFSAGFIKADSVPLLFRLASDSAYKSFNLYEYEPADTKRYELKLSSDLNNTNNTSEKTESIDNFNLDSRTDFNFDFNLYYSQYSKGDVFSHNTNAYGWLNYDYTRKYDFNNSHSAHLDTKNLTSYENIYLSHRRSYRKYYHKENFLVWSGESTLGFSPFNTPTIHIEKSAVPNIYDSLSRYKYRSYRASGKSQSGSLSFEILKGKGRVKNTSNALAAIEILNHLKKTNRLIRKVTNADIHGLGRELDKIKSVREFDSRLDLIQKSEALSRFLLQHNLIENTPTRQTMELNDYFKFPMSYRGLGWRLSYGFGSEYRFNFSQGETKDIYTDFMGDPNQFTVFPIDSLLNQDDFTITNTKFSSHKSSSFARIKFNQHKVVKQRGQLFQTLTSDLGYAYQYDSFNKESKDSTGYETHSLFVELYYFFSYTYYLNRKTSFRVYSRDKLFKTFNQNLVHERDFVRDYKRSQYLDRVETNVTLSTTYYLTTQMNLRFSLRLDGTWYFDKVYENLETYNTLSFSLNYLIL